MNAQSSLQPRADDQAVESFFQGVRALTAATRPSLAGLPTEQAFACRRDLQALAQTVRQLQDELGDDTTVPADPIRAKLEQMVRSRELLAPTEVVEALGLSRQALSKAVAANRMFYVDYQGLRLFPAFYANPVYRRSQLEAVSKLLGDLPGGSKLQFFMSRRGSLGGATPLEALAQGRLQKVKDLAQAFVEG